MHEDLQRPSEIDRLVAQSVTACRGQSKAGQWARLDRLRSEWSDMRWVETIKFVLDRRNLLPPVSGVNTISQSDIESAQTCSADSNADDTN